MPMLFGPHTGMPALLVIFTILLLNSSCDISANTVSDLEPALIASITALSTLDADTAITELSGFEGILDIES